MIDYSQYAKLAVKIGANVQKGQCLSIKTFPEGYYLARLLAKEAYKVGAKYVQISMMDNYLMAARAKADTDLDYFPDYEIAQKKLFMAEDWATFSVASVEEDDALNGADPKKVAQINATQSALRFYKKALGSDLHSWCVLAANGPKWAELVLGKGKTEEDMWEVLTPILKLDQPDPVKAWRDWAGVLANRCKVLNDMHIEKLHFVSPGSDMWVYLNPKSKWDSGLAKTPNGVNFLPNIPTYECWVTPNFRKTTGHVSFTRPAQIFGSRVEDGYVEFQDGKVTKVKASKNQDVLASYMEIDDGAAAGLGEFSMVDYHSPISKSGCTFNSILFDENAACHIAFGSGYPSAMKDLPVPATDDELREAGCNISSQHNDMMVGAAETKVTATTFSGSEVVIMDKGDVII